MFMALVGVAERIPMSLARAHQVELVAAMLAGLLMLSPGSFCLLLQSELEVLRHRHQITATLAERVHSGHY
jgi:hypothetical protein